MVIFFESQEKLSPNAGFLDVIYRIIIKNKAKRIGIFT